MMKRTAFWLVLLGILVMGMAVGPDLWAAPGQSPERQTVPTRTPTPPPPSPTSRPPKAQPTPVPTATVEATPTEPPSEPLLPEAGGRGIYPLLGAALMTVGFLVIMVVKRSV